MFLHCFEIQAKSEDRERLGPSPRFAYLDTGRSANHFTFILAKVIPHPLIDSTFHRQCLTKQRYSSPASSKTRVSRLSSCKCAQRSCLLHGRWRNDMFNASQSSRGFRSQCRHPRPTSTNCTSPMLCFQTSDSPFSFLGLLSRGIWNSCSRF